MGLELFSCLTWWFANQVKGVVWILLSCPVLHFTGDSTIHEATLLEVCIYTSYWEHFEALP